MKRSELYARVWSTPMTKLAAELGISDVGLAKACRRHAVPAPPRGYWAKLRAGQKPAKTALPTPELDVQVHFAISDPDERARQKAIERKRVETLKAHAQAAEAIVDLEFVHDLDDAHPLIKATKKYSDRIPKLIEQYKRRGVDAWRLTKDEDRPPGDSYGRYSLLHRGLLDITASLESMDWVLRFHSSVFKGLVAGGMVIARREAEPENRRTRTDGPAIEARFKGEIFTISCSQGYRRVFLETEELARKRKEISWAKEYEYRASDKLTFSLAGTEYQAKKAWVGTMAKLQELVPEIVRTAFQLVPLQVEMRKQREAAAVIAEKAAEVRALRERRARARAEQLKQAFQMAEVEVRVRQLTEFLKRLEQTADVRPAPSGERVRVWIEVVREELAARNQVESMLQECLSVPSWSTWPPNWWPVEIGPDIPMDADDTDE
jgi:hypothetical protein